jgi:hypothetical protein
MISEYFSSCSLADRSSGPVTRSGAVEMKQHAFTLRHTAHHASEPRRGAPPDASKTGVLRLSCLTASCSG